MIRSKPESGRNWTELDPEISNDRMKLIGIILKIQNSESIEPNPTAPEFPGPI